MRIILTGGGTAGHVLPHQPVVEELRKKHKNLNILYIGSAEGPERKIVQKWGWNYEAIPVGKFRRYFDLKNITDPFKVVAGVWKAHRIVSTFKPHVLFSKGGYVSLPVIVAAWIKKVPIVIHDSDAIPGLTTRIVAPWVEKICLGYAQAKKHFPKAVQDKIVVTGIPIRKEILKGNRMKGFRFTGLNPKKPVVLVLGGSLGSKRINGVVEKALPELLKWIQVVHITGTQVAQRSALISYVSFEYVDQALADLYAMANVVVSRAGANTLAELLALKKRMVLIPLSSRASHGDQEANAKILKGKKGILVISDEKLNANVLVKKVKQLLKTSRKSANTHWDMGKASTERPAGGIAEICGAFL